MLDVAVIEEPAAARARQRVASGGRYHDESASAGRSHRVLVGLHQIPASGNSG